MSLVTRASAYFFPRTGNQLGNAIPRFACLVPRRFEQWLGLGEREDRSFRYEKGKFSAAHLESWLAMNTVFRRFGKKPEMVSIQNRDWRLYTASQEGPLIVKALWDPARGKPYLEVTLIKE
ncbi:MAG: hypothetical protein A3E80_01540 [Chlamydiae bacterium RIFCSPHIGHO2_12_FULL_49_9]|nr:MAG: hypothetical protein A3E80_01540 [Chlamydiae bacterium RIFCSPHIGHO2_12_FULL_49_9]